MAVESPDADGSHLAATGAYKPGSIQKIVLKNFLTYKDVVITPGARLNIVIGANGTGKSTILNAICLGLGGEPKLLGRADDARDYVMHAEESASIAITLTPHPGKPTHVIERVIDRNRGSEKGHGRGASTFFINGEKCGAKEVRALVLSEYRITIDNLCTFLPQDKVSSFSSMSEQDRLLETEKTLDGDYYDKHQKLIEAVAELSNNAGDLESMKQKLKKYKHEIEQLERAAALVAERQKALEQADLIGKKKLWVEFDLLRNKALQLKEAKTEIKKKIADIVAELMPLQEKEDKLQALREKAEADYKAHNDETNRCKKEMEKQTKKNDGHDDEIEEVISQLNELDSKRSKLEAEVKAKKARLNEVENSMNGIPSMEEVEEEIRQVQAKRKDAAKRHDRAKRHEHEIDLQMKDLQEEGQRYQKLVAKLENVAENRKKQVFRAFPQLNTITTLIDGNRGSFRRQVWGPTACEIGAQTEDVATMIEQHVPNHCLKSYVVEEQRDYDRLYTWIRDEKKLPINVNLVQSGVLKPVERPYSKSKMEILKQRHGVRGYMDECFTAPDAIMQNLRNVAAVHKVLIGDDKTMDSIDNGGLLEILARPEAGQDPNKPVPFCIFATKGNSIMKFTGKVSRYSGKISFTQDNVRGAQFLSPGINEREKAQAEAKLAEVHKQADDLRPKIQEAQLIRRQLEAEVQEVIGEADAAQTKKRHIVKFQSKYEQAKRQLQEALDAMNTDDTREKKTLSTKLMNLVTYSITALCTHADQQEKLMKSTIACAGSLANKSSVSAALTDASNSLQEKRAAHSETEEEARRIQADFLKTKKLAGDKKAIAEERAPLVDENGNETELKLKLEEIAVDDINELECAYEDAMAKANEITDDPNAVRHYEKRKKEIEELEEELERRTSLETSKVERVKQMGEDWETGISKHIVQVNKLFIKYMAKMGCTGEIVLSKGKEGSSSYKDWGIQILVSFRQQTKAQPLSAERNSGGERSVCTIMYLMALQEMMVAPFRCVDEINQGLDERNERLVFNRIVQNSCRAPDKKDATKHSGQYFLITPKLLPNLTDMEHEAVSVLFVMNGPHCFSKPDDWQNFRLSKFQRRRARVEDEENSGNSVVSTPAPKKGRLS